MPGAMTDVAVRCAAEGPIPALAAARLAAALAANGSRVLDGKASARAGIVVTLEVAPASEKIPPDGFDLSPAMRASGGSLRIAGGDARGLLYGALDVAEWVALGYSPVEVKPRRVAPALALRAVELVCDPPKAPDADAWLFGALGEEYLDILLRGRFNALVLRRARRLPEGKPARELLDRARARGIVLYLHPGEAETPKPLGESPSPKWRLPERPWNAHQVYASPRPADAGSFPAGKGRWVARLWNEGAIPFRFGSPAFVTEAVSALRASGAEGFVLGSGADFPGPDPAAGAGAPPRFRENEFRDLLWGRLAQDPETRGEIVWHSFFERKFGRGAANDARAAREEASAVWRLVLSLHGGVHPDGEWYPSAGASAGESGRAVFQGAGAFGNKPFARGLCGIPALVEAGTAGKPPPGESPLEAAAELDRAALRLADRARRAGAAGSIGREEMARELADALALAALARYYARKVLAAEALDRFLLGREAADLARAEARLAEALAAAGEYRSALDPSRRRVTLGKLGAVEPGELLVEGAEADVELVAKLRERAGAGAPLAPPAPPAAPGPGRKRVRKFDDEPGLA